MIDCPPPMIVFEVEHTVLDDRTLTAGQVETDTRTVIVDYMDNRNAVEDHFWSYGAVTLVNNSEEDRRIRYRQVIPVPPYHWVDVSSDERACFDYDTHSLVLDFVCEVSIGAESVVSWDISFPVVPGGDINLDGYVDAADIGLMLAAWDQSGVEDIDRSGNVDSGDLGILISQWTPQE
tara:strand:- start:92 stop:625 length:534 start_codon:yes stop_codon:yes gene_type:complete